MVLMEVSHEGAILKLRVQEKVLEQSSSKLYRPTRIKRGRRCRSIGSVEARIPQQCASRGRPEQRQGQNAAHKSPVCSRCHSYIRNDRVAGQLTRLRDCKEGFKRMDSTEKTRALETVRVFTRCTSWKHRADMCRQRCMPCTNSQAGQWVLLGGSSTVRSTGGGESRIQEHVSLFATYAATMGSPSRKCARSALVLEDPGATATY